MANLDFVNEKEEINLPLKSSVIVMSKLPEDEQEELRQKLRVISHVIPVTPAPVSVITKQDKEHNVKSNDIVNSINNIKSVKNTSPSTSLSPSPEKKKLNQEIGQVSSPKNVIPVVIESKSEVYIYNKENYNKNEYFDRYDRLDKAEKTNYKTYIKFEEPKARYGNLYQKKLEARNTQNQPTHPSQPINLHHNQTMPRPPLTKIKFTKSSQTLIKTNNNMNLNRQENLQKLKNNTNPNFKLNKQLNNVNNGNTKNIFNNTCKINKENKLNNNDDREKDTCKKTNTNNYINNNIDNTTCNINSKPSNKSITKSPEEHHNPKHVILNEDPIIYEDNNEINNENNNEYNNENNNENKKNNNNNNNSNDNMNSKHNDHNKKTDKNNTDKNTEIIFMENTNFNSDEKINYKNTKNIDNNNKHDYDDLFDNEINNQIVEKHNEELYMIKLIEVKESYRNNMICSKRKQELRELESMLKELEKEHHCDKLIEPGKIPFHLLDKNKMMNNMIKSLNNNGKDKAKSKGRKV